MFLDSLIKKNSFMQQNQENPAAASADEEARFTSFLQKMIGNAPANANLENLITNENKAKANPNIKGINLNLNIIIKLKNAYF
jgi:hypothetical protein